MAWQGVDTKALSEQVGLIAGHIKAQGTADDADGSLYVGPAGIAFAFYHKAINLDVSLHIFEMRGGISTTVDVIFLFILTVADRRPKKR